MQQPQQNNSNNKTAASDTSELATNSTPTRRQIILTSALSPSPNQQQQQQISTSTKAATAVALAAIKQPRPPTYLVFLPPGSAAAATTLPPNKNKGLTAARPLALSLTTPQLSISNTTTTTTATTAAAEEEQQLEEEGEEADAAEGQKQREQAGSPTPCEPSTSDRGCRLTSTQREYVSFAIFAALGELGRVQTLKQSLDQKIIRIARQNLDAWGSQFTGIHRALSDAAFRNVYKAAVDPTRSVCKSFNKMGRKPLSIDADLRQIVEEAQQSERKMTLQRIRANLPEGLRPSISTVARHLKKQI